MKSSYAVIGASGHLGRLAIQELLDRGVRRSRRDRRCRWSRSNSAVSQRDYAVAAVAALVQNLDGDRAYEIARGDLETSSQDFEQLLGRPATSLVAIIAETLQHHA